MLLLTGCYGPPARWSRVLFDGTPFESGASAKYDRRALAKAVDKDPFPKAKASDARPVDETAEAQQ
jgi:hypothetical protein